MSEFDKDEEQIHDMFSKIRVDSSKLTEQVKSRLHAENPNATTKHRRYWAKPAVTAIIMSIMLVATVGAAVGGGFDWFIAKINPSFGGIVEPIEMYSEDQGIRMEVIGAQKYDNRAIVYLSLQDITGQNRLTEQASFRDGFDVGIKPPTQDTAKKASDIGGGSFTTSQKMLYFNEDTNTVYYEFNIIADSNSPLADPLQLSSFLVYFDEKSYEDEPIPVSLVDTGVLETIPILENQIFGAHYSISDAPDSFSKVLTPGHYADMPHGEEDQWVSNIGIIDGKLHVQIGQSFNKEFGSSGVGLSLKDTNGKWVSSDYGVIFLTDKNNHLVDVAEGYDDATYRYVESVFSVDTEDLDDYTLCFTGFVSSGVTGKWSVAANLSDPNQNMSIWTNNIPVEGHLFEHITLSPLGLQVVGTYQGEVCLAGDMVVEVETTGAIIPLEGGSGTENSENHTFNLSWDTKAPLDVSTVKAVIINGVRIPAK